MKSVYECASCGSQYKAIDSEWVVKFDAERKTVLWRCPRCGRLQKDIVHMLGDE